MPFCQSHSISDKGLHRDNNEDCFLSAPEQGLWAVADGMGGHAAGEVASAIVVGTLMQETKRGTPLPRAISLAHRAVLQAADSGEGASGMGSTVVALSSSAENYEVCWVGDSRAYLWTASAGGGQLEQLTTDHSYVQMLLASGAIGPEDVHQHPDKHIITQCIGSPDLETVAVDSCHGTWQANQWVLLCSDGLTDELDDKTIAQLLCDANTPEAACQALLQRALRNGGRDNITAQVIQSPRQGTPPQRQATTLPRITGSRWLDLGMYGLALISVLLVTLWTLW